MRLAARFGSTWVTEGPLAPDGGTLGGAGALPGIAAELERIDAACAEVGRDPATLGRLLCVGMRISGVTDVVVPWPRRAAPFAGDTDTFELVAAEARARGAASRGRRNPPERGRPWQGRPAGSARPRFPSPPGAFQPRRRRRPITASRQRSSRACTGPASWQRSSSLRACRPPRSSRNSGGWRSRRGSCRRSRCREYPPPCYRWWR